MGKRPIHETGQATVEFILGAAFAVAVVALCFVNSSWLPGSVQTIYARTWAALDEEPSYGIILANFGTASLSDVASIDNAQRVAADREALANLGRVFLGKTMAEVKSLMRVSVPSESSMFYHDWLERNQGVRICDYDIRNREDGLDEEVWTRISNTRVAPKDLTQWMQGDYDHYTGTKTREQEENVRYFFSDDMIYSTGVTTDEEKNGAFYNSSIRATFTFDENYRVDSVRLWVTRNQKIGNSWRVVPCNDLLDVIVTE